MAKAWDEFRKEYDDKTLKSLENSAKEVAKIKQQMLKFLNDAYTKEDALADTIPKAKMAGITGKRTDDFRANKEFSKALGLWKKAVETYQNELAALSAYCDAAEKTFAALKRKRDAAEKEFKKEKASMDAKAQKEGLVALKKSAAVLDGLKKSSGTYGTLKTHEVFYAARLKASIDGIVAKAIKECEGEELPEILEDAKRSKNIKAVLRMVKSIDKYSKFAGELAESDVDKAKKSLNEASKHMTSLAAMNKEYQAAFKKQKKFINAHNEKKAMIEAISKIAKAHKTCTKIFEDAEDKVEDAVSAS